jgi:hypothetical protein
MYLSKKELSEILVQEYRMLVVMCSATLIFQVVPLWMKDVCSRHCGRRERIVEALGYVHGQHFLVAGSETSPTKH